jgi:hypothetical protein
MHGFLNPRPAAPNSQRLPAQTESRHLVAPSIAPCFPLRVLDGGKHRFRLGALWVGPLSSWYPVGSPPLHGDLVAAARSAQQCVVSVSAGPLWAKWAEPLRSVIAVLHTTVSCFSAQRDAMRLGLGARGHFVLCLLAVAIASLSLGANWPIANYQNLSPPQYLLRSQSLTTSPPSAAASSTSSLPSFTAAAS